MSNSLSCGIALALGLAVTAHADTPPDCAGLVGVVEDLSGYSLSAPPAPVKDSWCVLDGARLTAPGRPDLSAQRLCIYGRSTKGLLVVLGLDVGGMKFAPSPGTIDVPDWLQSAFRHQSADLTLHLYRNEAEDQLEFRSVRLVLSGGTELKFDAILRGAGFSRGSILTGALTELLLRWTSDGHSMRPVMEAAGQALDDAATGEEAVALVRTRLLGIANALPRGSLVGTSLDEMAHLIRDLPQGRGQLALRLSSSAGLGVAQVLRLSQGDDPARAEELGQFLAGTALVVDWQPGLFP